ncbi:DUF5431 family protein [Enterobacter kobei]|nr:DUF5431 family protein [Enterobacter kobei]
MPRQHQDSLLDAARQGEEGHETATKLDWPLYFHTLFIT